jgi:hypothetical protein
MKCTLVALTTLIAVSLVTIPIFVAAQSATETQQAQATTEMPMSQPATQSFTGTVVSWDGSNLVVKTDTGSQMSFTADAQTQLPTSISTGSNVSVQYRSLEGGKYLATSVTGGSSSESSAPMSEATTSEELPATASPLGPLALTGILTLGAALVLRSAMGRRN